MTVDVVLHGHSEGINFGFIWFYLITSHGFCVFYDAVIFCIEMHVVPWWSCMLSTVSLTVM